MVSDVESGVASERTTATKRKARKPAKKGVRATAKGANRARKAAAKAKAKATRKPRQRDIAKLDDYGFRKDSVKSEAAALYARKRGATLAEVREAVGSVQFNVITQLETRGFKIGRTLEEGAGRRSATRYFLKSK